MTDGYQALTEKEKQALRLLLGGHDAKSMATHLGLSVHTVNERLRDARRKLSVSSSKAAARLLHAAEAPQSLGDSFSGGAAATAGGHTFATAPAPSRHRAAWTIGGVAMITLFATALALAAGQPAAAPAPANAATAAAETEASRAARDWLALVDARKWPESYAATAASFRSLNSLANWQGAAEQVHARLGPALSRDLISDEDTPAPPNGYRTVRFRTLFPGNQGRTEVLSLAREGGQWRVVGVLVE